MRIGTMQLEDGIMTCNEPGLLNKCIVIFSGFNQRAVIAFIRTISKHDLDYVIIAKSIDDPILLSEYRNKVLVIRKTSRLDMDDMLLAIKEMQMKHFADEYIIAPSSEALNRFFLDSREMFKQYRCHIPLVDKVIYESISDKLSFGKLCKENNIDVPGELEFSLDMTLPVVAKPKEYFSKSTGKTLAPVIINTPKDLESFCVQHDVGDFYFQEYINGKCLYLLYCFANSGKIFKFSQENIVQQAGGKSMVYAISSDFHYSKESLKYEALLKKVNFRGLVMIEIKQRESKKFMIEANPRFWGPSQLFVDAGANLFEAWLYDIGLIKEIPSFEESSKVTKYFWFGGVMDTYKKKQELTFHSGDEMEFLKDLPLCLQIDVYRRTDTIEIFKGELTDGNK